MTNIKVSTFIIAQDYSENDTLLFNTLTTSIIVLPKEAYKKIFIDKQFNDTDLIEKLLNAGFLLNKDFDEAAFLEKTRKNTIATNSHHTNLFVITPTMDCNARCYYCFENGAHHEKMTKETADAVIKYVLNNCAEKKANIQWFGGEPTLATDIIDYISSGLIENGIELNAKLITNGYLFDEEMAKRALKDWKVDLIQFTIDALGEEYNKIKRYIYKSEKSPFEIVLGNIKSALNLGFSVRIRINFNPLEIEKTQEIILFLKEHFCNYKNINVYFAPIDSASSKVPSITLKYEQLCEHPFISLLNTAEDFCTFGNNNNVLSDLSDKSFRHLLKRYLLHPIPNSCYGVCNCSVTIDSLGDIYICHRLLGKGRQYSSGNVFLGIEKNQIYHYYSDYRIADSCGKCALLPVCQGGCKHRRMEYGKSNACIPIKGVADKLILRAFNKFYKN